MTQVWFKESSSRHPSPLEPRCKDTTIFRGVRAIAGDGVRLRAMPCDYGVYGTHSHFRPLDASFGHIVASKIGNIAKNRTAETRAKYEEKHRKKAFFVTFEP